MESSNNKLVVLDVDEINKLEPWQKHNALNARHAWLKKQRKTDKKYIKNKGEVMRGKKNARFHYLGGQHLVTVWPCVSVMLQVKFSNDGEINEHYNLRYAKRKNEAPDTWATKESRVPILPYREQL